MSRSKMADEDDFTDVGDDGIEAGDSEPRCAGEVERRGDKCCWFMVVTDEEEFQFRL